MTCQQAQIPYVTDNKVLNNKSNRSFGTAGLIYKSLYIRGRKNQDTWKIFTARLIKSVFNCSNEVGIGSCHISIFAVRHKPYLSCKATWFTNLRKKIEEMGSLHTQVCLRKSSQLGNHIDILKRIFVCGSRIALDSRNEIEAHGKEKPLLIRLYPTHIWEGCLLSDMITCLLAWTFLDQRQTTSSQKRIVFLQTGWFFALTSKMLQPKWNSISAS